MKHGMDIPKRCRFRIWPSSWLGRLAVGFGVAFALLTITAWQGDNPVSLVLRARAHQYFAPQPALKLEFAREPADRPVLSSGTSATPMIVMDPCVVADGNGYHLFFSSFFCETVSGLSPFWKPEFGEHADIGKLVTAIAYAHSTDRGKTWSVRPTPLLLPSDDGWDDFRVETASVLVQDGVLHLFYCADMKKLPARYQIGEVSLDLSDRTLSTALLESPAPLPRRRTAPVLAADFTRSCFHNNLQEPSVLPREGGGFELYFVGLQLKDPTAPVKHPGQGLKKVGLGRADLDDALKVLEITAEPLLEMANIVEVKRVDGKLVLFTTSAGQGDAHRNERIAYHTSPDGRSWSRSQEVISSLPSGFDAWGCMSPTVVQEQDRWVLFYTALENLAARPADRWGIPMGANGWLYGTLGRAECAAPKGD